MSDTVIMIHGANAGGWCFENFKGLFEEKGFKCLTPTLRLHDVSPSNPPPPGIARTSLLDYASDMEALIRGLDAPPIVIGHSMGGLIAQILAARGLLKAAVLIAPAWPSGIINRELALIFALIQLIKRYGFWKKPFKPTFREAVDSALYHFSQDEQARIYNKFVNESGRVFFEIGMPFLDKKKAATVDEKKVTCPVLVIGAANDKITPPAIVKKIAEKYKHVSTYKEFSGHDHWIVIEDDRHEVAAYILDWLGGGAAAGVK
jgi:pimeloyl-ACP methyl ester carboxylesterase